MVTFLLSWTLFVAGVDSCALCAGDHVLECRRCDGEGTRGLNCNRCAGKRKVDCPIRQCRAGLLPCQACFGSGSIRWDTGATDPCKVCASKGTVRCGYCLSSGSIDCPGCQRSGRQVVSCGACLGRGRHPCPLAPAGSDCPLCHGVKQIPCGRCQASGGHATTCERCRDTGRVFCTDECKVGFLVCRKCYGSGKIRKVMSSGRTQAGTSKCTICGGRGYERCPTCKDGFLDCLEEPASAPCSACQRGRMTCPRCP